MNSDALREITSLLEQLEDRYEYRPVQVEIECAKKLLEKVIRVVAQWTRGRC